MTKRSVAVIGSGYWGKNLVRNFHGLKALRTICDSRPEAAAQFLKEYPDVTSESSFEKILQDPQISSVVIATPAVTHFEFASKALRAGKDVFVEKPLALNVKEGRELVELSEKQKKILMVGHVLEYHPAFLKIHEMIESGQIGEIRYFYSNRLNFGKIRTEENILWSFAPHDIALILRLAGEMPKQVIAAGGTYIQPGIADVTVTQMSFPSNIAAHIFVSWLNPFKEQRFVVVGSDKMIHFDDVNKQLTLYDFHVDIQRGEPVPVKGSGKAIEYSLEEPLLLECKAFLESVQTRKPPLTDGKSGLRVLEVLDAAQKSLTFEGKPVILKSHA